MPVKFGGFGSVKLLFMSHVDTTGDCWLWTGGLRGVAVDGGKYGQFVKDGKTMLAHRAAYELFVGPIPEGMLVLHICDIPLCVNPKHLRTGTQADNMQDAVRKGRLDRKALAAGFARDPSSGRFGPPTAPVPKKTPEEVRANNREKMRRYRERKAQNL